GSPSRQVVDRVRQVPGVESASLSEWAHFRGWAQGSNVQIPGGPNANSYQLPVSPGFFETIRIRVLDGREFEARDLEANAPAVVVVNEMFAKRFFPNERSAGSSRAARVGARRKSRSSGWWQTPRTATFGSRNPSCTGP